MKTSVYIATSLDGYIADRTGGIDFLFKVPNPDQLDFGYGAFISNIDALIMGRVTFETVLGFDQGWPYPIPAIVLSSGNINVPTEIAEHIMPFTGTPAETLAFAAEKGLHRLYIDGGTTIQGFLRADLIDEMIITTMPVLLGGGFSLFGEHDDPLELDLIETKIHLNQIVSSHYRRVRA